MSMTKEEEARIIRAVLGGDTARFEDLVRENERGVYTLCLRMLGNEQDALDASQEAFFKAYRALNGFRGDSRFSTWLYRLASNVCLDMLRRRPAGAVLSMTDEEDGAYDLPDAAPSPQERLEKAELRAEVHRALEGLPPEFRQALILRDIHGLSYEEIGQITGLESGTVKSRIFRARRKLAEALLKTGNISDYIPSKKTGKGGADK